MDITFEKIDSEIVDKFTRQTFDGVTNPLHIIKEYQQVFRGSYLPHHQQIQQADVYEDDVWITTYPKSGTRWMQELVWCLKYGLHHEKTSTVPLDEGRVPFFEFSAITTKYQLVNSIEDTANIPRPRIIKTHLSYDMLPQKVAEKNPKIIHLIRNPRDVCVSHLNHLRILNGYTGDLKTIVDLFTSDFGPLYSPYFVNVNSYWKRRHELSNLLIVFYEDMQKDLKREMKRIATFLEVKVTEDEINEIADHISIEKMKHNPMVNMESFVKKVKESTGNTADGTMIDKGKSGRWKEALDDDMLRKFEQWEEKWFKDSDLKFTYEV